MAVIACGEALEPRFRGGAGAGAHARSGLLCTPQPRCESDPACPGPRRWSRWLVCLCWLCSAARRRSRVTRRAPARAVTTQLLLAPGREIGCGRWMGGWVDGWMGGVGDGWGGKAVCPGIPCVHEWPGSAARSAACAGGPGSPGGLPWELCAATDPIGDMARAPRAASAGHAGAGFITVSGAGGCRGRRPRPSRWYSRDGGEQQCIFMRGVVSSSWPW